MLKLVNKLILLGVVTTPFLSFAGENCSNRNDQLAHLSGIHKVICERAMAAGYSLEDAGCKNTEVAHYLDLDNSMSFADDKPGRAMGTVYGINGTSQGFQVCPGWYVATAHGVLDDLTRELGEGEIRHRAPSEMGNIIAAYPFSPATRMTISSDEQFISPRINNEDAWNDPTTDYVFIKVDNPLEDRKNDFLPLVSASTEELISYTNDNLVESHLYRGLPLFEKDAQGNYDFDKPITDINRLFELLKEPQRVNRACGLDTSARSQNTTTNCPTESGVSGAPMVTTINGQPFVSGIMRSARSINIDQYEGNEGGGTMLNSSPLCADLERACGSTYKCNTLQELLPRDEETVSL